MCIVTYTYMHAQTIYTQMCIDTPSFRDPDTCPDTDIYAEICTDAGMHVDGHRQSKRAGSMHTHTHTDTHTHTRTFVAIFITDNQQIEFFNEK